jgi:hypothetical protein
VEEQNLKIHENPHHQKNKTISCNTYMGSWLQTMNKYDIYTKANSSKEPDEATVHAKARGFMYHHKYKIKTCL